jgi:hypothetical protein
MAIRSGFITPSLLTNRLSKHAFHSPSKAVRGPTLKAVGVKIFRADAVRRAVNKGKAAHGGGLPALMRAIHLVKECLLNAWGQLIEIFNSLDRRYGHPLIMAS